MCYVAFVNIVHRGETGNVETVFCADARPQPRSRGSGGRSQRAGHPAPADPRLRRRHRRRPPGGRHCHRPERAGDRAIQEAGCPHRGSGEAHDRRASSRARTNWPAKRPKPSPCWKPNATASSEAQKSFGTEIERLSGSFAPPKCGCANCSAASASWPRSTRPSACAKPHPAPACRRSRMPRRRCPPAHAAKADRRHRRRHGRDGAVGRSGGGERETGRRRLRRAAREASADAVLERLAKKIAKPA